MNSPDVMRELENLLSSESDIDPNQVFAVVDKLQNKTLRKNILVKLVSRGVASSSRQAESWRHLTAKTSIDVALDVIRNYKPCPEEN